MILNNRKCIVTRESKSKEELIRIVKTKDGTFHVDSDLPGRGAYISKDADVSLVLRNKVLHRAFKIQVPKEVYDKLEKCLDGGNDVKK